MWNLIDGWSAIVIYVHEGLSSPPLGFSFQTLGCVFSNESHLVYCVLSLQIILLNCFISLFDSDALLWNAYNLPFTNMINSVLTPLSTLMIMLKEQVLRETQWNVFLAGQWVINNHSILIEHFQHCWNTLCVIWSRTIAPRSLYGFISLEKAGNYAWLQDMLIRMDSLRRGQYLQFFR